MARRWAVVFLLGTLGGRVAAGEDPAAEAVLPPAPRWSGASRSLAVGPEDPWVTPCEASGFVRTPRYGETVAWLKRLAGAAPQVKLVSLGKSPEGRDVWMVVASREGAATPGALRATGRPVLLVQAGIHSGEIDGKDAGLMLLRDLTVRGTRRALLERASLLFVPILSVDGHERFSRFSRINQRGPEESGWRTTSRNLNLNRDYAKVDTPEMRALVRALDEWDPDLYFDVHVTDGADYRYDITWGHNGAHAHSPAIAAWLDGTMTPHLERALKERGHVPGPLVFPVDGKDLGQGIRSWTASPRYSHGYGDARHLASVLVENHSLKPYDQRVLGTTVLLTAALEVLAEHGGRLREATREERARRRAEIPVSWRAAEGREPETVRFLGIRSRLSLSPVSGDVRVEWTGEPETLEVPVFRSEPDLVVRRPRAYWIPPAWTEVIERLSVHGIRLERIREPRTLEVEMLRLVGPELAGRPFEGHVRVAVEEVTPQRRRERFPAGSVRVPTDQPLGDLAVLLLEPQSPDSFFRWGFFLEVLQRTEYADAYVMEAMAERMLAADPGLRDAFQEELRADAEFRGDPRARLLWFYRRTPFFDQRHHLYPVARETGPETGAAPGGG
ncbi:MAG: M14 family metallopeptidase [Planctomycetota bacterium]